MADKTMLYRPSETPNPALWGRKLDARIVGQDEIDAALAEGWLRHPDDLPPAKPKGRLTLQTQSKDAPNA